MFKDDIHGGAYVNIENGCKYSEGSHYMNCMHETFKTSDTEMKKTDTMKH